jgi:DNA-binding transcriptional MerR regulator
MSTREAATKVGLTDHTLRWYERIGLLERIERGPDGRRRFSDADLTWLTLLTRLRATGMPVAEMRRYAELVRSGSGEADRLALLCEHRERVNKLRRELDECAALLDYKIDIYRRAAADRKR